MPGTLMLSLQGAAMFEKMYGLFAAVLAVCLTAAWLSYRYRENIYRWVERMSPPVDDGTQFVKDPEDICFRAPTG